MQELKFPQLKKILKRNLNKNIVDIFIIGSFMKNKLNPNDIDIIILFKEKNLGEVGLNLHKIRESLKSNKLHLESIFADTMFKEPIFVTILHEGFSIKHNKEVHDLLNLKSFTLFNYSLGNLSKIEKVKFAQILYGRKKDGLLYREKAISLGAGSFKVPVEKEEIFKEFFSKWKVKYNSKRTFVNN